MPQKKSAIKRRRQDVKLNERNRAVKSKMATAVKQAENAPAEEREAALRKAISAIDKAAKAGVIKKATADRKKSRLTRAVLNA